MNGSYYYCCYNSRRFMLVWCHNRRNVLFEQKGYAYRCNRLIYVAVTR